MKTFVNLLALMTLTMASFSFAQSTATLTGTVTDPNGQTWNNATVTFNLVNPMGGPVVDKYTGAHIPNQYVFTLSATGVISGSIERNDAILSAGTYWVPTAQSNTSATSQTLQPITINTSSFNAGTAISSMITAPQFKAINNAYGYADNEVINPQNGNTYTNVVTQTMRVYTAGSWADVAGFSSDTKNVTDFTSFAAAVAGTPSGWVLYVPASYLASISTQVNITNPITVKCDVGGTIQQNASLNSHPALNIIGNNVIFDGCTFDGNNVSMTGGNGNVEVNAGVSGFEWKNGSLINMGIYGIRLDGTINALISNNIVSVSSNGQFFQAFGNGSQPTVNLQITNNRGVGGGNIQSPSPGGITKSFVFSGNQLTIQNTASTMLTVQDASAGHNSPLTNFIVSNNTCTLIGTSAATAPFGCFSIVSGNTCTITGNVFNAKGQYVNDSLLEFASTGCVISNNTFNAGADPANQTYADLIFYAGGNTFVGNHFNGWAKNNAAFLYYAQQSLDGTTISDNTLNADSSASATTTKGISIECNQASGASANDVNIIGNTITGAIAYALTINSFQSSCPITAQVNSTTVNGAANLASITGVSNSTVVSWGQTNETNVAAQFTVSNAILNPASFPAGYSQPGNTTPQPQNFTPDSNFQYGPLYGWTFATWGGTNHLSFGSGLGIGGNNAIIATGDGTNVQNTASIHIVGLQPNTTYSFGGAFTSSGYTTGTTRIVVCTAECANQTTNVIAYVIPTYNCASNCFKSTTFTTGASQTDVWFGIQFDTVAIPSGSVYAFSNPQFNLGSTINGYVINPAGPNTITNQFFPTPFSASLNTTSASSDNVTIPGMTANGHCWLFPTDATAATNSTATYVSAKTTNQITVTHSTVAGMTYDIGCTPN